MRTSFKCFFTDHNETLLQVVFADQELLGLLFSSFSLTLICGKFECNLICNQLDLDVLLRSFLVLIRTYEFIHLVRFDVILVVIAIFMVDIFGES